MALGMLATPKEKESKDLFRSQLKKTRLCSFYMEGRCRYGTECGFAHDSSQIETPPDLKKTSLCAKWQKGQCSNTAANCMYAHGKHDLRMTPQFSRKLTNRQAGKTQQEAANDVGKSRRPTDNKYTKRTNIVAPLPGLLDREIMEPHVRSQASIDHGLECLQDGIGKSWSTPMTPPPGLPSTWMSEPMKVMIKECFDNDYEVPSTASLVPFKETPTGKHILNFLWEGDASTAVYSSDERNSRSLSP